VTALFPSAETLPANTLRLYVHFSQPMETQDAAAHVRLLDADGRAIELPFVEVEPGLWDPQQRRLTLIFHPGRLKRGVGTGEAMGPPLVEGRRYRIVVSDAPDARGMPMAAALEREIRVGPADRTSPRIEDVRVEAPGSPKDALRVLFPEPLDEALLRRLVWVEDARGERVDGAVEIGEGETRFTFAPAAAWTRGDYVLRVHPALEDRAGNRFDRLFDRALAAAPPPETAIEAYRIPFSVR
jgi:hypothetical protein